MERPGVGGQIILVRDGRPADADLVAALLACHAGVYITSRDELDRHLEQETPPGAVVVKPDGDESTLLADISQRVPAAVRLIAIGNLRSFTLAPGATPPECVLYEEADEATLQTVLAGAPPVDVELMLDELLGLTVFGGELPKTLQGLTERVARAFQADDCILLLTQESACYTAREISENVVEAVLPIADHLCQLATTLIAPPRPDRPYRAFLGMPLAHDNAPPLAMLLLCRERPLPFHRDAHRHLRALAGRLGTDLSLRLVQERLLADRDKLNDLSRIDPVLGVANRTSLQKELSQRVSASELAGEPLSVAVIDVDGLHLINERRGYPAGDAVLAHVAQVASKHARPQDVVARYAGDSVAIVYPGLAADEATTQLTKVLSEIDARAVMHESRAINLTVSAGVAELRYDDETGETALARAMAARQRARIHGDVIATADASVVPESQPQPDFAIGTTLGGVYQIRHEISRGAFGVVYRAEDLVLGRQVALKLLRPDLARDTAFVERFRTEAATLARIRNANFVQVYAFGIDGSNVFFAMELVEGQGLEEQIESARRRRRHLTLSDVVRIIDEIASALEALHQAGVLHRDVKPENVLIDRIHRRSVLVDVGIAVKRGSEKNPAGTPGFTAPEVFGDGGESPATDVYSLGALAYLLLTLQPPFGGDASPLEILHMQATERPAGPTQVRRDLPASVDAVVLSALEADPSKRPQSARAFAKALAGTLAEQQPAARGQRRQSPGLTVDPATAPIRRVTIRNSASLRAAPAAASTRGILFRSAYDVLGARRGNTWINEVSRNIPELALALAPQASPLAWHPTSAFISVLQSLGSDGKDDRNIAFQLGQAAIKSSFDQFYGANPTAVRPSEVLRAADLYWYCYHSWGETSVTAKDTDAEVTIRQGIANPLLCAATAGLLAGVISHAGGRSVVVEHPTCLAKHGKHCCFRLEWKTPRLSSAPVAPT